MRSWPSLAPAIPSVQTRSGSSRPGLARSGSTSCLPSATSAAVSQPTKGARASTAPLEDSAAQSRALLPVGAGRAAIESATPGAGTHILHMLAASQPSSQTHAPPRREPRSTCVCHVCAHVDPTGCSLSAGGSHRLQLSRLGGLTAREGAHTQQPAAPPPPLQQAEGPARLLRPTLQCRHPRAENSRGMVRPMPLAMPASVLCAEGASLSMQHLSASKPFSNRLCRRVVGEW